MNRPFTPHLRRRGRVLTVAFVAACALLTPEMSFAQTGEINSLRAEAARVADRLEELEETVSILDEDYNGARLRLESVQGDIESARIDVDEAREDFDEREAEAQRFVVYAYTTGGSADTVPYSAEPGELGPQRRYLETATGSSREAMDELRSSRLLLETQIANLSELEEEATEITEELENQRIEIESTIGEQTELLASVEGDLERAVAEEAERRAREEQARREAEAAARRAAAAAAQQSARQQAIQAAGGSASGSANGSSSNTPAAAAPAANTPAAETPSAETPAPAPAPTPAPTVPALPAPEVTGSGAARVIEVAKQQLGVPYRWGGESPSGGFDCSGLITYAYRTALGISLPHQSRAQYAATRRVSVDNLQPGDLVFFGPSVSGIHHVGLYVGGGQMIEAPRSGLTVRYRSIYRSGLLGGGRVL